MNPGPFPPASRPANGRQAGPWQRDAVVWCGMYYVATGLWPILHLPSFVALTGPKSETWLVRAFGSLVASVGLSMILLRNAGPAPAGVGLSAAVALAASDVWYVLRRRIRPTYLLDAALEALLAAGLARRLWREGTPASSPRTPTGTEGP